jgi:serine/threonine protein kinase
VLYRGQDTLLGREVAVKVMDATFLGDAAAHARFFREAKAAARLQHVNIVTVFEFGEHDETPYIVTEFLRGHSLAERLQQDPPMSLRDKLDTAIQLCAGLEAAHTQGVVHRDVKPRNVWICQDGTVKLLDFGIATAASSGATRDVLGSVGYVSPEQVAGKDVDQRTDVFSSGVVLYEMLSGRRPFEADSPTAVMLKIVNEIADPIDDSELPPALVSAVRRAMEKSPAARHARASELGRDLKTIKADLPIAPEPATLLIDRTVLLTPPPPVTDDGITLLVLLDGLRHIRVGRVPVMAVVLIAGLAAGAITWYFWPTRHLSTPSTTHAVPGQSRTDPKPSNPPSVEKKSETPIVPPPPGVLQTLRLTSQPSAANIRVDGRDTGKTTPAEIPIEASRPPTRIQLDMPGFKTEDVRLTAETLRSGTLNVSLTPREAGPRITFVATGDYQFDVMDRQRVLSSAREQHDVVVSGLRSVQLRSDHYFLDQAVRVDRAEGGTVKASAPPLGSITVYASGALEDCKVFIDDRIVDAGSLPIANRAIASGAHRVKLSCSRGETDAQQVTVLPHQSASARFPASTPVRPR